MCALPASGQPSSRNATCLLRSGLRIRRYESYWLWQPSKVIVVVRESVNANSTSFAPLPCTWVPPTVVPVTVWPHTMVGGGAAVVGTGVVGLELVGAPVVGEPVAHCMLTENSPLSLP